MSRTSGIAATVKLAIGSATLLLSAIPAAASSAVTLTPPAGTIVHPGDSVAIGLSIENGHPILGAVFHVKDRVERVEGAGPLALVYAVPAGFAGIIPIEVETFGPGPETYTASGRLVVRPARPIVAITADPVRIDLATGERSQLHIAGRTAGGEAFDISSSGAETTYTAGSGGEEVISITPEGIVEARGPGREVIDVRNGDVATMVLVTVAPANHPPKISPVKNVAMKAGESLVIRVDAADPEGQGVRFTMMGHPPWMRLTNLGGGRGMIELRPTLRDAGDYKLGLTASDDGKPAMSDFAWIEVVVQPKTP